MSGNHDVALAARKFVTTVERLDEVALLLLVDSRADGVMRNYSAVLTQAREWAAGFGEVFWAERVPADVDPALVPMHILAQLTLTHEFPWKLCRARGSPRSRQPLLRRAAKSAILGVDAYEFVVCHRSVEDLLKLWNRSADPWIRRLDAELLQHRHTVQLRLALSLSLFLRVQRRDRSTESADFRYWGRVRKAFRVPRLDSKRVRHLNIFGNTVLPVLGRRNWTKSQRLDPSEPQPWVDICIAVARVMGWSCNRSYSATLRQFEEARRDIRNLPVSPSSPLTTRSRRHGKAPARARRSAAR